MKWMSLINPLILTVALLGSASVAHANSITYTETGIASGMIGASSFTNALAQVTLSGDTANVVTLTDGSVSINVNVSTLTRVTIAGIGTATVTVPTAIYSFPTPVLIDPGLPVLPYVVFGTLDNPPAVDSFTGMGGLGSNSLLGYDLRTAIGPITGSPGGVGHPVGLFVPTTLGNLSFTSDITPTMVGTFSATVPEPNSLVLLSFGIAGIAFRLRFRAQS
jgi:hypothetical protein